MGIWILQEEMEMSSNRQDAWNQDEDVLLAEVVLRYIREGGTQLQAFEEVGKKLSRTSAACGFRWNSFVRKQYKSGIELAKNQRKQTKRGAPQVKKEASPEVEQIKEATDLSVESIIHYLQRAEESVRHEEEIRSENQKLLNQLDQLQEKMKEIETQLYNYESKYSLLEEDHKSLLAIFEKARKMALLQGNEDKVKFQMDKNGNLQRLNK